MLIDPTVSAKTALSADPRQKWKTLLDMLEGTAGAAERRGIYLLDLRGGQEFRTYSQLLQSVRRIGAALSRRGVSAGDRLLLVQPTSFDFLASFFGATAIGAVPVPLPMPREENATGHFAGASEITRLGAKLDARYALFGATEPADRPGEGPTSPFHGVWDVAGLLDGIPADAAPDIDRSVDGSGVAYIQCTSGTTASRRGVQISHQNILQNVRAVGKALQVRADDVGVSWLPLYNIMGLVGVVCFTMYWGLDVVLIEPERFLKRPGDWLWALSDFRGTLSAAPNFAYNYCVRRCKESDLNGLDLSSWRVAMNGSEPVRAQHMDAFVRRFERYGLRDDVFLPVYGLSEATLGVTFGKLGERCVIDGINRAVLAREGRAEPLPAEGAPTPAERMHLVSVGVPLENVELKIVDRQGRKLPERVCGEVVVRGPNVMQGYAPDALTDPDAGPVRTRKVDGWLYTGDMGYFAEGRLFIVGRMGDGVTTSDGRHLYAEEIEFFVNTVDGVRSGSATVFEVARKDSGASNGGSSRIVIAFETQAGGDAEEVDAAIRALLKKHLELEPDLIVRLAPRSIPKTRSGKVRRFLARQLFLEGQLGRRPRGILGVLGGRLTLPRRVEQLRNEVQLAAQTALEQLQGLLKRR